MSNRSKYIIAFFKRVLPNPFTIAIILTVISFLLALLLCQPEGASILSYSWTLINDWQESLWDSSTGGLYFAFQMMLMLVLGHTLALTPFVKSLVNIILLYCKDTKSSVVLVSFFTILMGLFNWGLGLIFGAILAKSIGDKFAQNKQPLNYGLIGAAAYLGLMVWHGGISGSAPTKIMEEGYLHSMMESSFAGDLSIFPESIPFEETIGSGMNLITSLLVLIIFPLLCYIIARKTNIESVPEMPINQKEEVITDKKLKGAEKLDASIIIGALIGLFFISVGVIKAIDYKGISQFGFLNPNYINFMLLGFSLILHRSINVFLSAVQKAIGDISGILIQFPLYFGILGLMKSSGLIVLFSDFLIDHANEFTLPLYTFFSAGLVNFFVPSGGGQWAIQGPIILQAATELNANLPKTVMAMAYGDQLTNMLQPFWALPLLGITKLKAHQILPYTFLFFVVGLILYGSVLMLM
jgi:short-chain fatty acids transporter